MHKACPSRKADALDVAIASAIAILGVCALIVPEFVLHAMPDCLVSRIIHGHCIGCGMTHAAIALLHGNLALAWRSNPLSLIVVPMLLWIYARYLLMIWHSRASLKETSVATT